MNIKGKCNSYIVEAIKSGLRYEGGLLINGRGKVLKQTNTKSGYKKISLGPENKRRSFTVARLVCWLVHGEPPTPSHQVDHINRDRSDDHPDNLRWVTASENVYNSDSNILVKAYKVRLDDIVCITFARNRAKEYDRFELDTDTREGRCYSLDYFDPFPTKEAPDA